MSSASQNTFSSFLTDPDLHLIQIDSSNKNRYACLRNIERRLDHQGIAHTVNQEERLTFIVCWDWQTMLRIPKDKFTIKINKRNIICVQWKQEKANTSRNMFVLAVFTSEDLLFTIVKSRRNEEDLSLNVIEIW